MRFANTEQFEKEMAQNYKSDLWSTPRALPKYSSEPLRLSPEYIPPHVRDFCEDIAHRMQAPLDFVVGPVITTVGSVAGDYFVVQPRRNDPTYQLKLTMWCLLIGDPTVRKSPAISAVLKYLIELDRGVQKSNEFYAQEYELALAAYEANKSRAHAEARKLKIDKKPDNSPANLSAESVKHYFKNLEKPKPPRQEILFINECTPQKLVQLWMTNPDGFLIARDEIVALFREMEAKGQEGTRGLLMEAHDGQMPRRKGTKQDGVETARPLSSMIGTIQPDVLRNYISQNQKGNAGNDGFLPRFGLMLFPDPVEAYEFVDKVPNAAAGQAFATMLAGINGVVRPMNDMGHRIYAEEDRQRVVLKLDDEAYACYQAWDEALNSQEHLKNEDFSSSVKTHLGKYGKLVNALAGIFHLIEVFSKPVDGIIPNLISVDNFALACDWADYLERHALRAYGLSEKVSFNDEYGHARHLLTKILEGKLKSKTNERGLINVREIMRCNWGELKNLEILSTALEQLEEFGWLRVITEKNRGNKTSKFVEINPNAKVAE